MTVKTTGPIPYNRGSSPVLPGGDARHLEDELGHIQNSVDSLVLMCPQVSTVPPKILIDGMIRLSRNPWRPVTSQSIDSWVYYDAVGKSWRYLSTNPTTT